MNNTLTIIYIDDGLNPAKNTLENRTLFHLQQIFSPQHITISGFYRLEDANDYFLTKMGRCDLLISDQNLWWGKQPDESYTYKEGNTFFSHILTKRPELHAIPIIVYTDSAAPVELGWKNDGIAIVQVVKKYRSYDSNDHREPWEILAETVRSTVSTLYKEKDEISIKRER